MSAVRWASFTRAFLATALLLAASLLGLAFLLDPYDTGRSPLALKPGVRPQGPRMAAASRGRDPAFQAVIIGNSHIQLVSPEELTARTGTAFLSLATPGTGPKEALALLDWFLRKRLEPARAIVVGIDEHWCTSDPALPNKRPFPFWLLSRNLGDYLLGLIRYDVIQELPSRIAYLRSPDGARARPDGYWDYEANFDAQAPEVERDRRAALETPLQIGGGNHTGPFPAARALEALALAAAPEATLILLRPPSYVTSHPEPGSQDAAADSACRAAFAEITQRHPRSVLLDWRIGRPENGDPDQFFDHTHYRRSLAALVEADIADVLAQRP
ncbi:hypothetical protein [Bosea psychrotolerans]|uniref:Uncharacterized protein n=1 Tax=Bosea psychrotolerans TaxID=1871628 RepID=A0A2S4MH26_9HYPH|nr:hypothetical protein [Bosea psychrotolerans]POR53971.1 hypothetical protein CYD53_10368 [Bosea psychrotolerans]